ncbi:MAG: hypothetical protein ABIS67_14080, partial [Candidatus Eisenbacteria bacterium]
CRGSPDRPRPETATITRSSSTRLSYAALLVAAGLAGVYAESIPNFEILTLVVFCSGVLLGVRDGLLVGVVTELIYSVLNPYGAVHPLITVAQVSGEALAGLAGGIAGVLRLPAAPVPARLVLLAVCGALLTLIFDLITNLATGVLFGQMRATLIAGIPFALWHLFWNVVLFTVLGTPLVAVFARYRARLT